MTMIMVIQQALVNRTGEGMELNLRNHLPRRLPTASLM
jgi:hypothetical protein